MLPNNGFTLFKEKAQHIAKTLRGVVVPHGNIAGVNAYGVSVGGERLPFSNPIWSEKFEVVAEIAPGTAFRFTV